MLARLESSVNRIKQFTSDASHELRAPLSFTRMVAEVALRNPQIDAESRRAFGEIVDEGAKAAVLLGDMLTLARADSDYCDALWEPVDLVAVIENVCEKARPLAEERKLALSVSLDARANCGCHGRLSDPSQTALDTPRQRTEIYSSAGVHIEVALKASATEARVLVSDSGIGISQGDLPHIFDRFYRADPSRSQVEGSGLGLAIAKGIAEMHGGDLSAVSNAGGGTTFQIVLPVCSLGAVPCYPVGQKANMTRQP